jgi:apolipoprotein N-acyltransferase
LGCAALGGALLWLALPPVDWWPLAWLAPIGWVYLVRLERLPAWPYQWPVKIRTVGLLILAAVLFAAWLAVNWYFQGLQYRGYWLAELLFWPLAGLLLLAAVRLAGGRPYVVLWLVGFFFWLAALHWLRLPHWATGVGWIALSFYFAFYLPLFIGVARAAVHRLGVPVILAAPAVWTGLELARAHLLTGMTMASLAHTQYRWTRLIQVSDLAGAFGVSFVVMFVAACLARMAPLPADGSENQACGKPALTLALSRTERGPKTSGRWSFWPLAPAAGLLAAVLAYGSLRTAGDNTLPGPRIALVQGSIDTEMRSDEALQETIYQEYDRLSKEAVAKFGRPDLVVWPECMFTRGPWRRWYTRDLDAAQPEELADMPPAEFRQRLAKAVDESRAVLGATARQLGAAMLLGVDRQHFGREGVRFYNSSAYVTPGGELRGHYDKVHLVMFGEYVPWADYFPRLQQLTPLPVSVTAGRQPEAFFLPIVSGTLRVPSVGTRSVPDTFPGGVWIAPNICYESVLSHVIRRQITKLAEQDREPDVLVNLTNDGWFWGSSELEMHLACGVFRAVECRKPFLIAANTGISAWIDGEGQVVERGTPRVPDVILARVRLDRRRSPYLQFGDWPAGVCLAVLLLFAVAGVSRRRVPIHRSNSSQSTGGN